MRFIFASFTLLSLLVQHALSSSALGHELVMIYYIYRMECMVYGPDKTKLLGENLDKAPRGWPGLKPNDPIHPRPRGSAGNGMLTFFEFEQDVQDPGRLKNLKIGYDKTDTAGGRMTTSPIGDVINSKLKDVWKFGTAVPWRLTTEIYNEVLADWNQQLKDDPNIKKPNAKYTGVQVAQKMENILQDVRRDFEALPNKASLAPGFNDLFEKAKKNLDDAVAYRRKDNAVHQLDYYEKEKKWARKDLVIDDKVKLPDGTPFDELDTDRTINAFGSDANKISKWEKDTAELSGPGAKKLPKNMQAIASHLSVIQAWQKVQSAARGPVAECS